MPDGTMMNSLMEPTPALMRLWIDAPDATAEQLQRGVEALRALFEKVGADPWECAGEAFDQEQDDEMGLCEPVSERDPEPTLTAEEMRKGDLANAWREAYWTALKACFGYDLDEDEGGDFDAPFDPTQSKPVPHLDLSIRPASVDDPAELPRLEFTVLT